MLPHFLCFRSTITPKYWRLVGCSFSFCLMWNIPAVSLSCILYTLLLLFAFVVLRPGIGKKVKRNWKVINLKQTTFSFWLVCFSITRRVHNHQTKWNTTKYRLHTTTWNGILIIPTKRETRPKFPASWRNDKCALRLQLVLKISYHYKSADNKMQNMIVVSKSCRVHVPVW